MYATAPQYYHIRLDVLSTTTASHLNQQLVTISPVIDTINTLRSTNHEHHTYHPGDAVISDDTASRSKTLD